MKIYNNDPLDPGGSVLNVSLFSPLLCNVCYQTLDASQCTT